MQIVSGPSLDDECMSYIVFAPCSCSVKELRSAFLNTFSRLDFSHKLMPSWNTGTRFVISVEYNYNSTKTETLSKEILSVLWVYKLINFVIVVQEHDDSVSYLNASTSISIRRSPDMKLGLYTWFPYKSPNRCTQVEDVILLDNWIMKGEGFFVHRVNRSPQKTVKRFNGCSLSVTARSFDNMVRYKLSRSNHSNSSTPVIEDG